MPSFQEMSCDQQWPESSLYYAIAGLVTYNNSKELMLCGYYMTGCRIWTEQGWIQSDTTFKRRLVIHVIHFYYCVSGGGQQLQRQVLGY